MASGEKHGTINNRGGDIHVAAEWLAVHRQAVEGAIIPLLRGKFDLTLLEAIEAAKLAHTLEFGGA